MVHGLEGSGQTPATCAVSACAALQAGFAAHRFNMRTCGGTEHLCHTLYHAGLTSDLLAVLREFHAGRPRARVPGGLLTGRQRGAETGRRVGRSRAAPAPRRRAPCPRRSTSPPARAASPSPRTAFTNAASCAACAPACAPPAAIAARDFAGLRSVVAIDDRITAPSFGFGDAANYYRTQSAIALPGRHPRARAAHPGARTIPSFPSRSIGPRRCAPIPGSNCWSPEHGGHLGSSAAAPHRFWADQAIMEWIVGQNAKSQPLDFVQVL